MRRPSYRKDNPSQTGYFGLLHMALFTGALILLLLLDLAIVFNAGQGGHNIFLLSAFFFFSVFARPLLPYLSVFFLGILQDILTGGPIGLYAALFILFVIPSRLNAYTLHKQAFLMIWAGYAGLMLIYTILRYALILIQSGTILTFADIQDGVLFLLFSILLYPALHRGYSLVLKYLFNN